MGEFMNINNKRLTIIAALSAILIGVGSGEYALYKKFEHKRNTIQEMMRWPYNEMYTRAEKGINEIDSLYHSLIINKHSTSTLDRKIISITKHAPTPVAYDFENRAVYDTPHFTIELDSKEKVFIDDIHMYDYLLMCDKPTAIQVINPDFSSAVTALRSKLFAFKKNNYNFQWYANDYFYASRKLEAIPYYEMICNIQDKYPDEYATMLIAIALSPK